MRCLTEHAPGTPSKRDGERPVQADLSLANNDGDAKEGLPEVARPIVELGEIPLLFMGFNEACIVWDADAAKSFAVDPAIEGGGVRVSNACFTPQSSSDSPVESGPLLLCETLLLYPIFAEEFLASQAGLDDSCVDSLGLGSKLGGQSNGDAGLSAQPVFGVEGRSAPLWKLPPSSDGGPQKRLLLREI